MLYTNFVKSLKKNLAAVMVVMFAVSFTTGAIADVPFPGKLSARIVKVEAANIIDVNFQAWAEVRRNVRIFLPNLAVPAQGPNPKECEYELAKLAYEFTVNFLENARDIHVNDMWMENSASEDAISSILTSRGSLDDALIRERLAKPIDLAQTEPWC